MQRGAILFSRVPLNPTNTIINTRLALFLDGDNPTRQVGEVWQPVQSQHRIISTQGVRHFTPTGLLFSCRIGNRVKYDRVNNCISAAVSTNGVRGCLGNLWTYIGYFRRHFPNDWSTNCRPMVARTTLSAGCVLVVLARSATTPWRAATVDAPSATLEPVRGKIVTNYEVDNARNLFLINFI